MGRRFKKKIGAGLKGLKGFIKFPGKNPVFLVAVLFSVVVLVGALKRFKVGRRGNGAASLRFFNRYLRIMAGKGFKRPPSMTPLEFAHLAVEDGGGQYRPALSLTDIYYRIRYGGKEMGENELDKIDLYLKALREVDLR